VTKTDQYLRYFREFQYGVDIASISKVQYRPNTRGNGIYEYNNIWYLFIYL